MRSSEGIPEALPLSLKRFRTPVPPLDSAEAAVLILLRERERGREVLLLERTNRPEDPASGQIALPGGHRNPDDRSLLDTVLRECREEVGLLRADLRAEPQFVTLHHTRAFHLSVAVFAGSIDPAAAEPRSANPEEVASVFWLPRERLTVRTSIHRRTPSGSAKFEAVRFRGYVIWGFTLRVLMDFFASLDEGTRT